MEYLYTIRIPLQAMYDLEARHKAKDILSDVQDNLDDMDDLDRIIKLQNIFSDRPPRGIKI